LNRSRQHLLLWQTVIERSSFEATAGEEGAGNATTHYHHHLSLSRMQVLPAAESIRRGFV